MITEGQIRSLSKKFKINEVVVAREFVQLVFLKELYEENFSRKIFFKGGTAIRLLYGGTRFSEDLDFTVELGGEVFTEKISLFFRKLGNQYPFEFKKKRSTKGITYLLTTRLPFLSGGIFVKLDFSMRETVIQPVKMVLESEYPVIVQSYISSLSKDEILAEKCRAFMKREKHRDLYDLWILHELGAKFDEGLIAQKMEYYGDTYNKDALISRLDSFSKEGFVKDLRPFVPINERERLSALYEYVQGYLKKKFA